MRFSVFTVSLPEWTPDEAVVNLACAGYHGVEWRVVDQPAVAPDSAPGFWSGNRCTLPLKGLADAAPAIERMCSSVGMAIPNLGTYVSCADPASVDAAAFAASRLGAPCFRVGVPGYDGSEPYLRTRDRAISQYRDVQAIACRHGVRALVEIHMGNICPSASAAAAFVANFDPRWVGVIHDAGNMVYEGFECYRLGLEVLGPYLAHVHLKNSRWVRVGKRPDGSVAWQPEFCALQDGQADLGSLIRALRTVGYDGWLSFEDFSTDRPIGERVSENIAFVKKLLAEG